MHLCSGAPPSKEGKLLLVTDPREVDRQLKRRQKNRVAAQRSRQKHTDKADELHQEHEWLERDNLALRKEIWSLQAEAKHWLQALEEHQRVCLLAVVPASARPHPDCWSQTEPAAQAPPARQRALLTAQTFPVPLQAPASPSGSPSGAALTQTRGPSSLLASSSGLSPRLPAPPRQSACLLPLGAGNLREDKTEDELGGPSVTPHRRGAGRAGPASCPPSSFDLSSVLFP
ncbi:basic leucine zipper transcriptional factor ATF-like 2 isoform X3 [Vombatus ursinus]|uniref:basic leucine zipper transcriptional factor ATF-like 2 isoform X3 n=1 Tax=Vombatus ursinus TaxID=29139 RepID=UPI000FFD66EE|nr:basic leucine zipper transcriptional factor ATF-like 2 isoform X3 [Vombatus ursinus]